MISGPELPLTSMAVSVSRLALHRLQKIFIQVREQAMGRDGFNQLSRFDISPWLFGGGGDKLVLVVVSYSAGC